LKNSAFLVYMYYVHSDYWTSFLVKIVRIIFEFCGKPLHRWTGRETYVINYTTSSFVDIHCVSKNDTDVAHYNLSAHQPILVGFGRDVAERACYQMVICYPTSPN